MTLSYAEFGERFFFYAVTAERIEASLERLAGDPIAFGPIAAGPGGIAQVKARGTTGAGTATPVEGDEVRYRLAIPVSLELRIQLGPDHHDFDVGLVVGLDLHARAEEPLRVVIDIAPPTWRDVEVNLSTGALRSSMLQRVAGIDREIARFVAKYVAKEIDKEHIRAARDIDIAARIEEGWRG